MRRAITDWRMACSIGWPNPRSAPSDNTISNSASRTLTAADASVTSEFYEMANAGARENGSENATAQSGH